MNPISFVLRGFLVLILSAALSGCARHYTVTLGNGHTIATRGKPKLNAVGDALVYRDTQGREHLIPAGSVREIAPR